MRAFASFMTGIAVAAAILAPQVAAAADPSATLSAADRAAAFRAAGFARHGSDWRSACATAGEGAYSPGRIDTVQDLNGDGRPEAVIVEESSFCYGFGGAGFALVSRQQDGRWRRVTGGDGVPIFLAAKGAGGWPDLQLGGPGFCHPVQRWNGRAYALHHHEYEGKRCRPSR